MIPMTNSQKTMLSILFILIVGLAWLIYSTPIPPTEHELIHQEFKQQISDLQNRVHDLEGETMDEFLDRIKNRSTND